MHVWSDLARDLPGILLFLLWLALPPLYLYAVGHTYLRRYQALYQQLRAHNRECACCCEPEPPTEELAPLDLPDTYGRHTLLR